MSYRLILTFAELLKEWQERRPASEAGWVFASYDGKPFHAAPIQQDYFRPAGRAVGLKGELGWHTFRHSLPFDAGRNRGAHRSAAEAHAARSGEHDHERLRVCLYGREAGGHSKVVQMVLRSKRKGCHCNGSLLTHRVQTCLSVGLCGVEIR